MAKMSFEEYLQARAEYNDYLKGQPDPEKDSKPAEDHKAEEKPEGDPAPEEKPAADPAPENDLQKQLDEIKAAMGVMAKALQPSLGDIKPVGIDDVVKKFFDVK